MTTTLMIRRRKTRRRRFIILMLIGRERKQVKGRKTENSTSKITNYFSKTI